ncbi:MAG: hypothetical protein ACXAD7_27300 [Candidatus Kariarchaeaceae archaeon]
MIKLSPRNKSLLIFLILLYINPLILLSAVTFASLKTGIPLRNYTSDPITLANRHPTFGIVSNFGVLVLCACATLCLFHWVVLPQNTGKIKSSRFLFLSGLFTLIIMLDDFFLGHETLQEYVGSEKIIYLFYVFSLLGILIVFRDCILESDYIALIIALGFLGLSVSIDIFQESIELVIGQWRILLEDGFKLLGIVGWFGYFARYCYFEITNNHNIL